MLKDKHSEKTSFFTSITQNIKKLFSNLKNGVLNFIQTFRQGNVKTRLSFLIMGYANLANKQIIKGLMYLFIQIFFISYMMFVGINSLIGFFTLGTKTQGWVFDENRGIDILVDGDNSMLMLIFGVVAIVVIISFICFYFVNIKSARNVQILVEQNKSLPKFKDDLKDLKDSKFHITMLTVPIIGIVVFTILPLIFMILIAFTNYDAAHQPPGNLFSWIGFENFRKMIFEVSTLSKTFFPILSWTLIWAVIATFSNYILGIILALGINKKGIKFKRGFRTIFIITIAVPGFVSLLVMRNMLNEYGPINELLLNLGLITERINFLTDPFLAKISIIVVNLWIGIPYTMLVTTGILMNMPQDLYEAARVDGASSFTIFRKITMPQIIYITTPYLITSFIGNINNFNVIFLLTGGGPTNSEYYFAGETDLLITWLYKLTVDRKDYNIAATIGIIVFVISIVISLVTFTRTAAYKREEDFS